MGKPVVWGVYPDMWVYPIWEYCTVVYPHIGRFFLIHGDELTISQIAELALLGVAR
jgi:hypothetical protein